MRHFLIPFGSALILLTSLFLRAQDPVLFQGFYWDVPAGGIWWDTLAAKAGELADVGIDMIWFPPPFKGAGGDLDMGYGIYDHFDAGEFLQ
ncbi:MAG: alpha-amylase, partial [Calditrichaeota bacterium]